MPRLFVFGLGYSALAIAGRVMQEGWTVAGTTRSTENAVRLKTLGIEPVLFDGTAPVDPAVFAGTTHLLNSVPADPNAPVLSHDAKDIQAIDGLEWIGYLSTTSVYG